MRDESQTQLQSSLVSQIAPTWLLGKRCHHLYSMNFDHSFQSIFTYPILSVAKSCSQGFTSMVLMHDVTQFMNPNLYPMWCGDDPLIRQSKAPLAFETFYCGLFLGDHWFMWSVGMTLDKSTLPYDTARILRGRSLCDGCHSFSRRSPFFAIGSCWNHC